MDRYSALANSATGRAVLPRLGLPVPPVLRRYEPGQPLTAGPVLLAEAGGGTGARGTLAAATRKVLAGAGVQVLEDSLEDPAGGDRLAALVLDASGMTTTEDLGELHRFFSPSLRRLAPSGRVLVLARRLEETTDVEDAAVQRSLEGFTRSVGKEVGGRGATSQLVRVAAGAHERLASPLRFLLSARSAFVSGQVVDVGTDVTGTAAVEDWDRPLAGRAVLVTGASRGIGEAIARTAARDGARVVAVDVPAAASGLADVADAVAGSWLALDVTAPDAAARIARHARDRHGRLDVVVHNAGITRDRRLVNLREPDWRAVLEVNLAAPLRITRELLDDGVLGAGGRVVGVSSVSGIAGNNGQTNYATSKAGVIGMVHRLASDVAGRGITVNAVAPGFIETQMTARVPLAVREAGRRLSSHRQGGQPVDVAEAVAWFASPASTGITGTVLRVDGQAWLGA